MKIIEKKCGDITLLEAQGKLNAESAPETEQSLAAFVESGARQLVLDLSGVDYISSAGLRALLSAAKLAQKAGGKLVLAAAQPEARKILDTAGFSSLVPIFETTDQACSSFMQSPKQEHTARNPISIAEEIYLLALDDERGILKPHLPASALDYALAGALLMELAIRGRIDTDLKSLNVISHEPTGDPLLDEVFKTIQQKSNPQPVSFWLAELAGESERIEKQVLERLIGKGILKQENKRILWMFETRRYPMMDDKEIKEVRSRLRELILGDEIPDPREVLLISLGNTCHLLDDLFTKEEFERLQPRITSLARLDLIGQEISQAIHEIEKAMAVAMLTSDSQNVPPWA